LTGAGGRNGERAAAGAAALHTLEPAAPPLQRYLRPPKRAQVHFYSLQGAKLPKELSFGPEVEAEGIGALHMWGDGLVVLSAATKQLWAASGLAEPRAARLAPVPGLTAGAPAPPLAPGARPPSAGGGAPAGGGGGAAAEVTGAQLGVIKPEESLSRCLEVVVAAGDRLWVVDERGATDTPLPPGAGGAAALAVAPGGGFVAAFCGDGRLRVFASGALFRGLLLLLAPPLLLPSTSPIAPLCVLAPVGAPPTPTANMHALPPPPQTSAAPSASLTPAAPWPPWTSRGAASTPSRCDGRGCCCWRGPTETGGWARGQGGGEVPGPAGRQARGKAREALVRTRPAARPSGAPLVPAARLELTARPRSRRQAAPAGVGPDGARDGGRRAARGDRRDAHAAAPRCGAAAAGGARRRAGLARLGREAARTAGWAGPGAVCLRASLLDPQAPHCLYPSAPPRPAPPRPARPRSTAQARPRPPPRSWTPGTCSTPAARAPTACCATSSRAWGRRSPRASRRRVGGGRAVGVGGLGLWGPRLSLRAARS
jgi:hypothetical protein